MDYAIVTKRDIKRFGEEKIHVYWFAEDADLEREAEEL